MGSLFGAKSVHFYQAVSVYFILAVTANKSIVEARIYNVSKGKYKLKIWNSGQVEAYDVDFQVPDELKGMVFKDKVPYEILESGKSFEEHIIRYMGMPSKLTIKTVWKDVNGELHEKEQIVSF